VAAAVAVAVPHSLSELKSLSAALSAAAEMPENPARHMRMEALAEQLDRCDPISPLFLAESAVAVAAKSAARVAGGSLGDRMRAVVARWKARFMAR
jgi:hypothetical protein